jgi:Fur family transcriptional regulator, peroxide stress response regulator
LPRSWIPRERSITIESLAHELAARGIRASYQRLRILQFLRDIGGHPTADEIYRSLVEEIPSLSKATVYNTLHAFLDADLVRIVDTDDPETRYDAVLTTHGHFRCDVCGTLTDFGIDIDSVVVDALGQHHIRSRSVVFRGICPSCLAQSKPAQE